MYRLVFIRNFAKCFDWDYLVVFYLVVVAQRYPQVARQALNTTAMSFEIPFLDWQIYPILKVRKAYYLKPMI